MMARIRSIHPDTLLSEVLANLTGNQERTWWRLLTVCDDEGRCLDNARKLRAQIYPMHLNVTVEMVADDLNALVGEGLLIRYVSSDTRLLQVRSWREYQHPQKPTKSRWSPPDDYNRPDGSTPPPRPGQLELSATTTGVLRDPSGTEWSGVEDGDGVDLAPVGARVVHINRKQDHVFEAVCRACGIDWREAPVSALGPIRKAVKELKAVNATPGEVLKRAHRYHEKYRDTVLTPTALAKHWPALGSAAGTRQPDTIRKCELCRREVDKHCPEPVVGDLCPFRLPAAPATMSGTGID